MILIIDNYDGCVYSIYQLVGICLEKRQKKEKNGTVPKIRIVRNDKITAQEAEALHPSHIILSGGAVAPEKAGNDCSLVRELAGRYPILGICLGYRVICSVFGGREVALAEPMQGKTSEILLENGGRTQSGIFDGLPLSFTGARYQSTSITAESIGAPLHIIARAADGAVMGVEARDSLRGRAADGAPAPLVGLQWHPESFMSEYGEQVMENFLR